MSLLKREWTEFRYGNTLTLLVRVTLGAMFLMSGLFKILDPESFADIITMYNIIPPRLSPYPAMVIPVLEMMIGFFFIVGFRVRASALISMGLMAMFTVFITVNVVRGETFDCGCFEFQRMGLGISETIGIPLIIRDLAILALFYLLFRVKKHVLSLDNLIEQADLREM